MLVYLRVNLLGPGPLLIKKRIYLAAVSQRLRNTALDSEATEGPITPPKMKDAWIWNTSSKINFIIYCRHTRNRTFPITTSSTKIRNRPPRIESGHLRRKIMTDCLPELLHLLTVVTAWMCPRNSFLHKCLHPKRWYISCASWVSLTWRSTGQVTLQFQRSCSRCCWSETK